MNRQQLEECAWKKTPKDERRSEVERYDWKTKTSVKKRLRGNEREVLVFDPSGSTPGSMSPWVPLWSLYSDELEQRCREEQQPKLRSPYNRMRSDYTGDVESSPGTQATREGAKRHHATKKSPAQLQREIDEALSSSRGRRPQEEYTGIASSLKVGTRIHDVEFGAGTVKLQAGATTWVEFDKGNQGDMPFASTSNHGWWKVKK